LGNDNAKGLMCRSQKFSIIFIHREIPNQFPTHLDSPAEDRFGVTWSACLNQAASEVSESHRQAGAVARLLLEILDDFLVQFDGLAQYRLGLLPPSQITERDSPI
jgi:hypothetical protein